MWNIQFIKLLIISQVFIHKSVIFSRKDVFFFKHGTLSQKLGYYVASLHIKAPACVSKAYFFKMGISQKRDVFIKKRGHYHSGHSTSHLIFMMPPHLKDSQVGFVYSWDGNLFLIFRTHVFNYAFNCCVAIYLRNKRQLCRICMTRSDNKCRAIWAKTLAEKFYNFRVDTYTLERKTE